MCGKYKMKKIALTAILMLFLITSCASFNSSNKSTNGNMAIESGEIILTTLFGATKHTPEVQVFTVHFTGKERIRLTKQSRENIERFSKYLLTFKDYEVSIEVYTSENEYLSGKNYLDERTQNIIKNLIKAGIDKDKIYLKGHPSFADIEMHYDESFAVIEAEIW